MELSNLIDEIMEAFNSEPEPEYGDRRTNDYIRDRGIRAHIWDLIETYNTESTEIALLKEQIDDLEDANLRLEEQLGAAESRIEYLEEQLQEEDE